MITRAKNDKKNINNFVNLQCLVANINEKI